MIATPPCQGMSVANHKKTDTEIVRNSLVVESIKIIKAIRPNFFVFENVPAFMKTICTDIDGVDKPIAEAIRNNLGAEYSYTYKIINFKNYGACSSRTRTVVIGVSKDYADEVIQSLSATNIANLLLPPRPSRSIRYCRTRRAPPASNRSDTTRKVKRCTLCSVPPARCTVTPGSRRRRGIASSMIRPWAGTLTGRSRASTATFAFADCSIIIRTSVLTCQAIGQTGAGWG